MGQRNNDEKKYMCLVIAFSSMELPRDSAQCVFGHLILLFDSQNNRTFF